MAQAKKKAGAPSGKRDMAKLANTRYANAMKNMDLLQKSDALSQSQIDFVIKALETKVTEVKNNLRPKSDTPEKKKETRYVIPG